MKVTQISFVLATLLILFGFNSVYAESKQFAKTDIGNYEISLHSNPATPVIGERANLFVEFTRVPAGQTQPHVDYEVVIFKDGVQLFSKVGHTHTGTDSVAYTFETQGKYVVLVFIDGIVFEPIPVEIAGFELNLGETIQKETTSETTIPEWVRNNAGWWADGSIDDGSFIQGLQYMIKEGIINIPQTEQGAISDSAEIPDWIKNVAGFWAKGEITDSDFVQGIQFMIKEGIIQI